MAPMLLAMKDSWDSREREESLVFAREASFPVWFRVLGLTWALEYHTLILFFLKEPL